MKVKPLWKMRLTGERRVRARMPLIAGDAVYQLFHYDKGRGYQSLLIACDAASGAERWRATIGHVANEPIAAPDGTILVSSFDGSLHAFAPDGRTLWQSPETKRNTGTACMAGDARVVVAELGQGRRTWCRDLATGTEHWSFANGGFTYPIAATDTLVVHATIVDGPGGIDDRTPTLFALAADSGRPLWTARHDQYLFMPVIGADHVTVGARGALLAFARADGTPTGRLALPPETAAKTLVPLADGLLVADDQGVLRRIDGTAATMAERWATAFEAETLGRPLPIGDNVALLDAAGNLHRLDIENGDVTATLARSGEASGAGGIATSDTLLALANGRELEVYRRDDILE